MAVAKHNSSAARMPNHMAQPASGRAVQGLLLEGEPEECSGRDQRHGVDRQPGQAQGCFGGGGTCLPRQMTYLVFLHLP